MPASRCRTLALAVVGAGPTASSLLERLIASVPELLAGQPLHVHLIDPHRAGTGRVWRPDLDPLLWMNSMAEDVTMFTDESVRCAGPIRPGPSLHEWAHTVSDDVLASLAPPDLVAEIRALTGMTFPTRLVQSVYLDWYHRELLASLPSGVGVSVHEALVLDLLDGADGRQLVVLDGTDEPLAVVDVVVLALGHLDARPDPASHTLATFAADHGLVFVAAGHTAELDLSVLRPGADVLAIGFGQAFTDLAVLVTEGRGGRFVEDGDGHLRYEPSGLEPTLHVGSRRGVPYRSKIGYRLQAPPPTFPRFLDDDAVDRLVARDELLDFRRDVLPLLRKEIGWATYHELFVAHPDRVSRPWTEFADRFAAADGDDLDRLVAESVPDPADRFEIGPLDRPLDGLRFPSASAAHAHIAEHVVADVSRRTDPAHSADLGAFMAMLQAFGPLGRLGAVRADGTASRVEDLGRWWFSFFMYYASGPPPARLRQFVALADAGLLHFVGADMTVSTDVDAGRFVARSASHPDPIAGTALVDARIAAPSVSRTTDVLLARLHRRGEAREEVVTDDAGWASNTGKLVVSGTDLRVVGADGTAHPRRHAVGAFTDRPAAGAFARPGTNAPAFRQHDVVARSVLATLAGVAAAADPERVMTTDVLANAAWHSLRGAHVSFADGAGVAVRYRPDVAVFHAVADDAAAAWDDLAALAVDGLVVLFREPPITPPPGWERVFGGVGHQMVLGSAQRDVPSPPGVDPATGRRVTSRLLTDDDVDDMVALVVLTEPGPFRPRTIELGGYVGIFHDRELVAMAGRRLRPPGFVEVSAVCTHPGARRGYAAAVSAWVATAIAADGDTPFLHVAATNTAAQAVYRQLGFAIRRDVHYVAFRPPLEGAPSRSSATAVATDVGSSRQIAGSAST